jgi:hypothetical protein
MGVSAAPALPLAADRGRDFAFRGRHWLVIKVKLSVGRKHPVGDAGEGESGCDSARLRPPGQRAAGVGRQVHGSSSSILWAGCSAIRLRTSASQACGLTLFIFAVVMRLYTAAARWPPRLARSAELSKGLQLMLALVKLVEN